MDIGKASAQEQMEMMTMLMQLPSSDQYPECNYQETNDYADHMDISRGSTNSIESTQQPVFHNSLIINSPVQGTISDIPAPSFPIQLQAHNSSEVMPKLHSMEVMREMMFRMAAMQPIQIDPESVKPPQRRNVKISKDPQSIAARHRRERISEKIRILQRLVPGGTKMDTASMLDEAVHYMKFLKKQVQSLEQGAGPNYRPMGSAGYPATMNMNYSALASTCQPAAHMVGSMQILS